MRYFLIVAHVNNKEFEGITNLCMGRDHFPSRLDMKESLLLYNSNLQKKNVKHNNIVITNVIEFKSEADYLSYSQ